MQQQQAINFKKMNYIPDEAYVGILQIIQESSKAFKRFPKNFSEKNRSEFLETLRKSHTQLYYCVNEITTLLEMQKLDKVAICIKRTFQVFNDFFEANNSYYERVLTYFKYLEKKEKEIEEFEFKVKYNKFKPPEISIASILKSNHEGGTASNIESVRKEIEEKVKQKKEEIKGVAKDEALRDYLKNGLDFVNDRFNFMADEHRKEEIAKKEKEFKEKVGKCVESIFMFNNDYLETIYEPRVILEVSKQVYNSMLEQSQQTVKSLNVSIDRLTHMKKVEPEALGELEMIADEMSKAKDIEFHTRTINPKYFKKNYLDDMLNSNENTILETFKKYNRKIAQKTLEVYLKKNRKFYNDFCCQTEDSDYTYELLKQVRHLKKERSRIQGSLNNQIMTERKKNEDRYERVSLELKMQKDKYSEVNQRLLNCMNELSQTKIQFSQNLVEMVENKRRANKYEDENKQIVLMRDILYGNLKEIKRLFDSVSDTISKCFPVGKHVLGKTRTSEMKDKVILNRIGMISLGTLAETANKNLEFLLDNFNKEHIIPNSTEILGYKKPLNIYYISDFRDFHDIKKHMKKYISRDKAKNKRSVNVSKENTSRDSSMINRSENATPINAISKEGSRFGLNKPKRSDSKRRLIKPSKRDNSSKRYTVDASLFSVNTSSKDRRLTSKGFSIKRDIEDKSLVINNVGVKITKDDDTVKEKKISKEKQSKMKKSKSTNIGYEKYGKFQKNGHKSFKEGTGSELTKSFLKENIPKITEESKNNTHRDETPSKEIHNKDFKTLKKNDEDSSPFKNHDIMEVAGENDSKLSKQFENNSPFYISDKYFYNAKDSKEDTRSKDSSKLMQKYSLDILVKQLNQMELSKQAQALLNTMLTFIILGIKEGESPINNTQESNKKLPRIKTGGDSSRSKRFQTEEDRFNFSKLIQGSPKMLQNPSSEIIAKPNLQSKKTKILLEFLTKETKDFRGFDIDKADSPKSRIQLFLAGLRDAIISRNDPKINLSVKKKMIMTRNLKGSIDDINRMNKKFKTIATKSSQKWKSSNHSRKDRSELDISHLSKGKDGQETPAKETPYGLFVPFNPFTTEKKAKKYSLKVSGLNNKNNQKKFINSDFNFNQVKLPQTIIEELEREFNPLKKRGKDEQEELADKIVKAFIDIETKKANALHTLKSAKSFDYKQRRGIPHLPVFKNKKIVSDRLTYSSSNLEENLKVKKFRKIVMKELEKFSEAHVKSCGEVCSHLRRFYQRIHLIFKNMYENKGNVMEMKKINISKMEDLEGPKSTRRRKKQDYLNNLMSKV